MKPFIKLNIFWSGVYWPEQPALQPRDPDPGRDEGQHQDAEQAGLQQEQDPRAQF